ncbi:V-type ATPase subunit [Peptoniphilus sp. oral taxon 386]|uniref:V-type ATPase subunit n=1 Tax=Peptoniphilus sp. oral taxon 386 TaxID=652713 RepID=UPI0001DAA045|nr:V-type ATPase subunit [Peptoniphilus sp. oral taxon 386]EFI41616.1 putative ATP synthase, subunit C [Peptoniphilus sp. oral taxon 386 str. F0131]
MRINSKFAVINAKIDSLYSKLLMNTDYIKLAHCNDVHEIIAYLKENTDIGSIFDSYDTVYDIELKMQRYKIEQIRKFSYYFSGNYKRFLNSLLSEFEISDIKKILRVLQRNNGLNNLRSSLIVLGDDSRFKIDTDNTIPTFVEKLKNTKYYKVLQAYEDEVSDVILFYMEMNLDKFFYTELINSTKDFDKTDLECSRKLYGRKVDLLNITWIYRGLKYYKILPEELINFCILGGCDFSYENLRDLCYCENEEEFVNRILKTEYKFLFEGENTELYMDRRINRYLYYNAKKEFRRSNFDIGKFLAFMFLLEYEIKDIGAVIEATRFDISFEETLKYLVRSYKGSEL